MNAIFHTAAGNLENQDRGAIVNCGKRTILALADGAGGTGGGAEAAGLAVETVRLQSPFLKDGGDCLRLLQELDAAIARDKIAGETTCVVAIVTDHKVFGASVGDSSAWVIGGKAVVDLTSMQIRKPLAGSGGAFPISFHQPIQSGEFLLLCTDGLFKYAGRDQIASVCRLPPSDTVPARLVELVRYPSGALPDDVTIIFAGI